MEIISINVNDLNAQNKRGRIFKQLEKSKADIICLQETHIKESDSNYLENKKLGRCFHAGDINKKKRGVSVFVKDEWKSNLIHKSKDGRMIAIEINEDQRILLINIYAPNSSQLKFYKQLYEMLKKWEPKNVCLIGDFNAIFESEKDGKSLRKRKSNKANLLPKSFLELAEEFNLLDAWRTRNE